VSIRYGGDYNPEQWPEEVWAEDMRLMREAGVGFVTVGVFSWGIIERTEGVFEFGWLDRVLDLLHENGISVDLATGTASPPQWLTTNYPEVLPVTGDGIRQWPGSRQHYCPSSPIYRQKAAILAGKLAERYAKHPAVIMWHINNEYACHTAECYCDISAAAFRTWLIDKYGDIDSLNDTWTTTFWSQHFTSFDQVLPPRSTPAPGNPTQRLDFREFSSDELLACFRAEKEAVRDHEFELPVTTNFIGVFKPLDYWKWAPELDVISNDSYPDPLESGSAMDAAMAGDLMRSLGAGRPWLLMEQAPGYVNWRETNGTKPGAMMRALSIQAVSRGADGINFFQWRQSRGGLEKFHSGMVPHSGTDSRIWRNVLQLGVDLDRLASVEGSRSTAQVAIVLDWANWWAAEGDGHQIRLDFHANLLDWYRPFYEANIAVDFVHPDAELAGYRLVLAPHLYLLSARTAGRLAAYVAQGGDLVVTYFTGHVDEHDNAHLGGYLAALQPVLGLSIDDFAALPPEGPNARIAVASDDWGDLGGEQWSEYTKVTDAVVLARFAEGDVSGCPAITRNSFGRGRAWYLGTKPDADSLEKVFETICRAAGIKRVLDGVPLGVEAARRGDYFFLINQTASAVEVNTSGYDLLTQRELGVVALGAYGSAVLRRPDGDEVSGNSLSNSAIGVRA
jgi:beta-galactosidase